jgi:hypothetical protein
LKDLRFAAVNGQALDGNDRHKEFTVRR